jgi:hypothetical protein
MVKSSMMAAAFACFAAAANAPVREVISQAGETMGMLSPAFYKGYIYWAGREPLQIFTPDGIPGPYIAPPAGTVKAIAADTDGTLAVAWRNDAAGFIDLHDPSGALRLTIPTGRYRPMHLAFGEDHSLWSLGWQTSAANPFMPDRSDYMIVRKFSPDGRQAGAYLPRSTFPRGLEPGEQDWQQSNCITVGHDRVGLWVYSGTLGTKTEWVELDLDGKLTGRWRLDEFAPELRVAMTSDGAVFLHCRDRDGKNPRLLTLDRAASVWRPVPSDANQYLVSADGESLIFADYGLGRIHLKWYPHP